MVLEDYDYARARGARIYAEIVGFSSNSDGSHITQPEQATMAVVMQQALEDAVDDNELAFIRQEIGQTEKVLKVIRRALGEKT